MAQALVHISSSQGDRQGYLAQAVERLSYGNKLIKVSNVYESNGDGIYIGSPKLLSACVIIETDMTPSQLLKFMVETENQLDRNRELTPDQPYSVDMDLVLFDQEVLRFPQITVPHPQAHERAFVMVPAAEIAPDWQHPILQRTIAELAREIQSAKPGWGAFFLRGEKLHNP